MFRRPNKNKTFFSCATEFQRKERRSFHLADDNRRRFDIVMRERLQCRMNTASLDLAMNGEPCTWTRGHMLEPRSLA